MEVIGVLGVVSSVLVIVSLVDQGARLLSNIARVSGDTRFETAKWDLWAEKKAIDAWASNMRRNKGGIPEEEKDNVEQILYAMRINLDKLETRMKKYGPFAERQDKAISNAQLMKLRVTWLNSGREEVQDLLQLVKTLTKALNIAAPPLPEYSIITGAISSGGTTSTLSRRELPTSQMRPEPMVLTTVLTPSNTESIGHREAAVIQQLIKVCATSATDMMRYDDQSRELLVKIKDKLFLWQQGLFNTDLGLEVILAEATVEVRMIREFLLASMVDIAYTEEQIIARCLTNQQESNRSKLEEIRTRLIVALAREETNLLTLERWKLSIIEEEEFGPKTTEEDLDFIHSTIEILFDVLPAIRGLRRGVILSAEPKPKYDIAGVDEAQTVTEETETTENATIELVEANLQQVRDVEREAEAMHQPRVTIVSKRLAKTVQRLEEWRLDALDNPKVAAGAHSNPQVLKKQEELARELSKYFRSADKQKEPATMSEKVRSVPDRAELTPENLELLVDAVDLATRHLFVATQAS